MSQPTDPFYTPAPEPEPQPTPPEAEEAPEAEAEADATDTSGTYDPAHIDDLLRRSLSEQDPIKITALIRAIATKYGLRPSDVRMRRQQLESEARAQVQAAAQAQPSTGQRVARSFTVGDQVEASRYLISDLTANTPDNAVCDRGALHLYSDGLWVRKVQSELVVHVCTYSGCAVGQKRLSISAAYAKGAVELALDCQTREGFFDSATQGVAFKNGFLAPGADLVPLTAEHRARCRYDFDFVSFALDDSTTHPTALFSAVRRYWRNDPDRTKKILLMQEFLGACILGIATKYERALVLHGQAGNDGKSTLGKVFEACMPVETVCSITPEKLTHEYYRAQLDNRRLCIAYETPEGEICDSAALKATISGDRQDARQPYGRVFNLRNQAGLLFICNRFFKVKDPDSAFRRRWLILEFRDPLVAGEAVPGFFECLRAEVPKIVAWGIAGALRLLQKGQYTTPASSTETLNEWMSDNDTLTSFVLDACDPVETPLPPIYRWTKGKTIYDSYVRWSKENGHAACSSKTLGSRIRTKFNLTTRDVRRSDGPYYPLRINPVWLMNADPAMYANGQSVKFDENGDVSL